MITHTHIPSDYHKVMGKHVVRINPIVALIMAMLAIILVVIAVAYVTPRIVVRTLNPPVLTFNPYQEVVKVEEADGKVLTPSDPLFKTRVQEIISSNGGYDSSYTGRLDGQP